MKTTSMEAIFSVFLYGATAFKAHHGGASASGALRPVEFLFSALLYINTPSKFPLQLILRNIFGTK
ncbi:MAG: hypothetical protein ACLTDS_07465 [Bianqueaceae bacterium]